MLLDIFIKGELIDLCIPTTDFVMQSEWYNWFNNTRTTRFLEQGIFPNTRSNQLDFLAKESENNSRLILIISDKQKYIGTISLSFINHEKKTASVALVIGEQSNNTDYSHLLALESMARIMEHGFILLGLIRIDAGQHWMLNKWQQRLELLGMQIEGLKKYGFIKGIERANSLIIAVTIDEYQKIKLSRNQYWDSASLMDKRLKHLPQKSFYEKLSAFIKEEGNEYYSQIFKL